VKIDSASLFVHRDSSSFISRWSDNLSKFSVRFDFDRELFVTSVYEKVFRSSVKDSLRQKHSPTGPAKDSPDSKRTARLTYFAEVDPQKRSREIDGRLKQDAARLRRECKVVLLGGADSGKDRIMRQMQIIYGDGYIPEERAMYQRLVYKNVIACAKSLVNAMEVCDVRPELDANNSHYSFLQNYTLDPDPIKPLDSLVGDAIDALRRDSCFEKITERSDNLYFMDSLP
jgi:hypothetical protein